MVIAIHEARCLPMLQINCRSSLNVNEYILCFASLCICRLIFSPPSSPFQLSLFGYEFLHPFFPYIKYAYILLILTRQLIFD